MASTIVKKLFEVKLWIKTHPKVTQEDLTDILKRSLEGMDVDIEIEDETDIHQAEPGDIAFAGGQS